jgi:hypothetical protein
VRTLYTRICVVYKHVAVKVIYKVTVFKKKKAKKKHTGVPVCDKYDGIWYIKKIINLLLLSLNISNSTFEVTHI